MVNTFKEMNLNGLPVSFRVIGYGESFHDVIQEIKKLGYEGLQVDTLKEGDTLAPTDEDKMIIILSSSDYQGIEGLLNTFHQAGVLTIVISTDSSDIATDTYDSLIVTDYGETISVVKTLLNPIFYQGRINYDFNDLAYTLRDSGRFVVLNVSGCGKDRMKDAVQSLSELFSPNKRVENLSLIIRANDRKIEPPLCMAEMMVMSDYIAKFPESVNIIWAMYNDETLDYHTLGLSCIASGRNLSIKR